MVRSSGPAVSTLPLFFYSLRNIISRETGYKIIKWTLLMELPPDNTGGFSADWAEKGDWAREVWVCQLCLLRLPD